ncbi:kelch-like protein 40b [Mizuhopecten yessoensis]|uniref:kelch-like protein 40b n=1 Tax=Mizuhopecten yessoensis TaxID=6573 RepID=UPI000B45B16C|nr:kelch-like protein 40b [Mizuhopecten yessoensis]
MTTLGHLIEAFENESFCDVEIKLEDGSILRAHAVILKLGSVWFRRRLSENVSTEGPVLCDNHAQQTMKDVIKFLYTSSITISVENVEELYMIANYYSIDRLSKMCTDFYEMVSCEKMTRKKQERQSIAENIEIDMPSGEDAKEIAIIYRSHGGMAFERLFRPDDSLKSIYTWLCAEVEADILPPKFSLGCSDPASCTAGGCKHTYPLTAEIANRSGIGSLPEVLFIKQEEFTGNDTLTGYDNVLFA